MTSGEARETRFLPSPAIFPAIAHRGQTIPAFRPFNFFQFRLNFPLRASVNSCRTAHPVPSEACRRSVSPFRLCFRTGQFCPPGSQHRELLAGIPSRIVRVRDRVTTLLYPNRTNCFPTPEIFSTWHGPVRPLLKGRRDSKRSLSRCKGRCTVGSERFQPVLVPRGTSLYSSLFARALPSRCRG